MNFVNLISVVSCLILLSVFCLSPAVHAQQGTFYFANESINYNSKDNPFLQWRIEKGAEVYTGRSYDISGAIGTSGFVAHWSDWKTEDTNCEPDTIIPVRYQESNGAVHPENFYIDPSAFPTGNYFTWDGCREWSVMVKQPDGSFQTVITRGVYPNENRFAFTVKSPKRSSDAQLREPSAVSPYNPPAFVIAKPDQTAAPVIPAPEVPAEIPAPWWIKWWWLELIVIGVVAFVFINDEFDIL